MIILTIRTDKPEAEIGLYDGHKQIAYDIWQAHRQLAETIHSRIVKLLESQNIDLYKLQGLIVYKGPGSFTGLRIGFSVANSLAYSLKIPIVSTNADQKEWQTTGIDQLKSGDSEKNATPDYGAPATTTKQRK